MGSATLQSTLWGQSAREWADLQEKQVLPMYEGALADAGPLDAKGLLDAGCGAGLALHVANEMGARVSGFDATPELVAIAKERLPDADIRVADLESIPFADESFDVVTAFNALQYAENPMNALAEMKRVTKRNGFVIIAQWGDVTRCETEQLFKELRAIAPPPPGTAAPLALSGDGLLEARLCDAGLKPQRWGEVSAPFIYPDYETAWRAMICAGPIKRVMSVTGEDKVRAVFDKVFKPSVQPDGTVRQQNVFRWVVSS